METHNAEENDLKSLKMKLKQQISDSGLLFAMLNHST
jgi:hypothetical protein